MGWRVRERKKGETTRDERSFMYILNNYITELNNSNFRKMKIDESLLKKVYLFFID